MGKRKENQREQCPGGKAGPTPSSPLLLTMDHTAARGAHRASAPNQPGVWGADGPLLPGGAGGIPAEVPRAPVEGGSAGVQGWWGRHQYPGSNRERRYEREQSQDWQGRIRKDPRLCRAERPARDPPPAVLHLSCPPLLHHQLPAAGGTIPRKSRSS